MHWMPATWLPVHYQGRTFTDKQTMTFRTHHAGVGRRLRIETDAACTTQSTMTNDLPPLLQDLQMDYQPMV